MIFDETTIQKLEDISIEKVAEELGIHVSRHKSLCFMHDDHHPSLAFFPSTNRWKCFVCDKGGNTINLVKEYLNVGFVDACLWLAAHFNIIIDGSEKVISNIPITRRVVDKPKPKLEDNKQDLEVLQALIDGRELTELGKDFLVNQRKYDANVVAELHIKSADKEDEIMNCYKQFNMQRLLDSGLVFKSYKGDYHPSFHTPCLFFPYYDQDGRLITIQSRYLGNPEEHQRFQFPRGSRSSIFNLPILNKLEPQEPIFISEGVTDCIALLSTGKSAVAIPSASSLKRKDLEILIQHPLAMYPDQDEPGQRLFDQVQYVINENHGKIVKLDLPEGCKDYSAFLLYEDDEDSLFEELRAVRSQYAKKVGLPSYCVCHDRTLHDMVAKRPVTELMLSFVYGMGWNRVQKYGEGFLAVLRKHPSQILTNPADLYEHTYHENENAAVAEATTEQHNHLTKAESAEVHRIALLPRLMPLFEKTLSDFEEKRIGRMLRMYVDGMNMEEIAVEFNLSRERVRQLLARAVKEINEQNIYKEQDYLALKKECQDKDLIIDSLKKRIIQISQADDESCVHEDAYTILIKNIDVSARLRNCLNALNIITLDDLTRYSRRELFQTPNFGKTCLQEVLNLMKKHNLLLKDDKTCDINDFQRRHY